MRVLNWVYKLFQPRLFYKYKTLFVLWSFVLSFFFLNSGYVWALFFAPHDAQQGLIAKLLYIHVPCAWLGLMCYAFLGLFSIAFVAGRVYVAYYMARSFAVVGSFFTLCCLVTGSIWGLPTWGAWWVWDARLTSMLILMFLYIASILVSRCFPNTEKGALLSSYVAITGLINLPIIKYSVDWFNTLHQSATVSKFSSPSMAWSMLWPLLFCFLGWIFFCMFNVLLHTYNAMRSTRTEREI